MNSKRTALLAILTFVLAASTFECFASQPGASPRSNRSTVETITEDSNTESEAEATEEKTAKEKAEAEAEEMGKQVEALFPDDQYKGMHKDIAKVIKREKSPALIKNDAVILGILMVILGLVFWTSSSKNRIWKGLYKVIPMLLMCYFLPSLLTLFGIVDPDASSLYFVATRYLLPATLVLLTLSINLKEVFRLGPKALIMFLTGTVGVVLGGPIAVFVVAIFSPETIGVDGPEAVWRGLSTVAGSWIGGGANQAAMQGIYLDFDTAEPGLEKRYRSMFSVMIAVDIIVAEVWMMFLLLGVDNADKIDRLLKADSSSVERLKKKMEEFSLSVARVATSTDLMVLGAIGFGATAISHYFGADLADWFGAIVDESNRNAGEVLRMAATNTNEIVAGSAEAAALEVQVRNAQGPLNFLGDLGLASRFFWLIVLATTIGIALSFTPLRKYEGAGASKLGTVFIFILVAVIGMGMDIKALREYPEFFAIGGIWMLFHVGLLFFMSWLIKAPYFFLAVGSKANIGGAASAPVVAAAFHPALAPVGVLLAVLGYALGTYGAIFCAKLMQMATPG